MLRIISIIGGLIIAAAAALLLTGEERTAEADEPVTSPAATYMGTILVDGAAPPSGGTIVAEKWNGWVCGTGTVYSNGTSAFYMITVHSSDTAPGCFHGADPIVFKFKGMKAQEIPMFSNWGTQFVDLTFKSTRYFQCTPELCPISSQPVFVPPPSR